MKLFDIFKSLTGGGDSGDDQTDAPDVSEVKELDEDVEVTLGDIDSTDPIYFDEDGRRFYAEDITAYIKKAITDAENERKPYELQWTLNSNFLSGHQNCAIRVSDETIQDCEPVHYYDSHEVFNCIKPLIDTRTANLMSVNYLMSVNPMTSDLDDHEKAAVSTKLLRYTQMRVNFDSMKNTVIQYLERTGNAYILSWWDKNLGELAAIVENPENSPAQTELHDGDLSCGIISPYELFVSDIYKSTMQDQRFAITKQVMTKDEIFDRYGIKTDGRECDTYVVSPVNGSGDFGIENATFTQSIKSQKDSEYVITYYEKPSRRYPDGRFAIMVGDYLIHYSSLPYDEIPITAIKCKEDAGSFYGKSAIEELIPLQRSYNGVKNRILDYYKRIAFPVLAVQYGTLPNIDDYLINGIEPGEILSYNGSVKPNFIDYPNLPDGIMNEAAQLKSDMEYTAGVSQLMVYGQVSNGTSGKAIDSRREIDSTRMSLTAENIRNGVKEMAVVWLHIYKRYATGYRCCKVTGLNDIGGVITWCSDDITSYDVKFDTENELKYSEDNQKQAFLTAFQMGLFNDESGQVPKEVKDRAVEILKVGSFGGELSENELQNQAARRENSYFEAGIIPEISQYDDHEVHLAQHRKYVIQEAYFIKRRKMPELAAKFDEHIRQHAEALVQQKQSMMQQAQPQNQNQNGKAAV